MVPLKNGVSPSQHDQTWSKLDDLEVLTSMHTVGIQWGYHRNIASRHRLLEYDGYIMGYNGIRKQLLVILVCFMGPCLPEGIPH